MSKDTTFFGIIKRLFSHIVRSKLMLFYTDFLVHLTVFSLVDLLLDYRFPILLVIELFICINELCQRLIIMFGLWQLWWIGKIRYLGIIINLRRLSIHLERRDTLNWSEITRRLRARSKLRRLFTVVDNYFIFDLLCAHLYSIKIF